MAERTAHATDPRHWVHDAASLLERLDIPYCIGGSWASSMFGEARLTRDIDIIVALEERHVAPLANALEPRFVVHRASIAQAVRDRRSFNAVDPEGGMKLDFFVLGDTAFDREEFSRRRLEALDPEGTMRVHVKAPEDSVLRKLVWFRQGGDASEHQWRDVLALLAIGAGRLDDRYLDRWAPELRVSKLLARARSESKR